MTEITLAWECI